MELADTWTFGMYAIGAFAVGYVIGLVTLALRKVFESV